MRFLPPACAAVCVLLAATLAAAAPGDIALTSGTQAQLQLKVDGRKLTYYAVEREAEPLTVEVQGPAVFVLRFRALTFGRVRGVVEIERDGNASVNRYELERDYEQDLADVGTSLEGTLHVRAPAGKQTYTVRPLYGPPLAVRLLKTKKFEEALAAAPEGQPLSEPSAPVSGFAAMVATPATPAPPEPEPVAPVPTTPAATPEPVAVAAAPAPAETPSLFTMKSEEESWKPPSHHSGFTMGFRGGVLVPFGVRLPALDFTAAASPAAALELGWDFGAAGTVFVEPAFHQVRRTRLAPGGGEEFLRSWSGSAGFMFPGPKWAAGGLRARLGVTGGLHESWRWGSGGRRSDLAPQRDVVVGGLAALGVEAKVDVVRISVELRWTQLLAGVVGPARREQETFGGIALLAGYRVDF